MKIISRHKDSHGTHGSPRITADLHEAGTRVRVNAVDAHMHSIGLAGISPSTFKIRTTMADHEAVFPPDLVNRKCEQSYHGYWISPIWRMDPPSPSYAPSGMNIQVENWDMPFPIKLGKKWF